MTPYFRKNQGLMRDPRWIQDTLERPNLSLVTGATALRVLFHEGVKPAVARGVRVAWKRGLVDVNVRKEVVVAAGFHQTPELLYISMIKENVHAYEHLTRRQAGETNLHGGPEGLTVAPTHTIVSTYSDGTQRSHCPHPACSVSEVGVFHYVWLLVSLLLMMTKGRGPLRNRRYLGYDSSPSRQDCPCPTMKGVGPGVIGGDLIMHGTLNLRVVDASIFPITRRCHFQSVYAVAEKAADLMKAVM